eukprot:3079261-Prymnesium_polylepis.1
MTRLMTRLMTKPASHDELIQIDELKLAHHSNLAMCHLRLGALRKARDCCSRALAIDPTSVKSLFRRGRCHALMGELDEAKADLTEVRWPPNSKPARALASPELHASVYPLSSTHELPTGPATASLQPSLPPARAS